jgi:phosphoribosyl 1,2-cyclic phosphodiesterase
MITFSLQSGSNGNAIYVEAGDVRLLFDAGISGKQAEGRMRIHGRDIRDVTAVIISHDHNDHVRCAGIYRRKFDLPIHMTRDTHRSIACELGPMHDVRYFRAGEPLRFNGVTVHTVCTPHDAADGVAFVVEHESKRLGILTDLGHPFAALRETLAGVDAAYLESNYDPAMLETGPYPAHLQARIRGHGGHLSNGESAELVNAARRNLRWVALAHLSGENNTPDVALDAHRGQVGRQFPFTVASRYDVSEVLEV